MAMPPLAVNGYSVTWSIASKRGTLYLHFADRRQIQIEVNSAEELSTVGGILRSSPTVACQPNGEVLIAGVRAPGT